MKRQYMECMLKRRQVKVIWQKVEEKREGIIPIIISVTSVVIDIEEVSALPMVKLAINARNYIILLMCVKKERLMLLIILLRNLTNISLLVP